MKHLERAGLVSFVPILGTTPGRQAVNPRRVYAVDTAMAIALSLDELSRESLFSTLIYNHIANQYDSICYTSEQGGCDFVASGEGLLTLCVQACWEADDPDLLQNKIDGLSAAMALTGVQRGVIVTLNRSERISVDEGEIEIVEADAFLSE